MAISLSALAGDSNTQKAETSRFPQFETETVEVWRTVIHPKQPLKLHRHDNKRIIIALTDAALTITNDKSESHKVTWKKGNAYLLEPDKPGELHVDINESNHPMEVMVVQFK